MSVFHGRTQPQGRRQWALWRQVMNNPQNSYPLPRSSTHRADLAAVRGLERKGLVRVEAGRYQIIR